MTEQQSHWKAANRGRLSLLEVGFVVHLKWQSTKTAGCTIRAGSTLLEVESSMLTERKSILPAAELPWRLPEIADTLSNMVEFYHYIGGGKTT